MKQLTQTTTKGFTLVELVTVIIVLGVVSVGISGFIRTGVDIYADVTERDQIIGDSRFVVERINRELRSAIPNSIRVTNDGSNQCLEFVPAEWVTFYTTLPVSPDTSEIATVLELADNKVNYSLKSGDFAVVYPTSNYDVYHEDSDKRREILSCTNVNNDCKLSDITNGIAQLTITQAFVDRSPASRLYIARKAVSYCVIDSENRIYRNENSLVNSDQDLYTSGVLMAENLTNVLANDEVPFSVYEATLTRNGLVQIFLAFNRNQEVINFNSEVHIPNVP
jgi:MSHA biogenesis protein MshO